MLGIFGNNPFMPRTPPKSIASDLVWWSQILANDKLKHRIPGPCAAFSDASSSVGIAVIIQGRWRAWRLIPGWNSPALRDIQWAEAIGFEFTILILIKLSITQPVLTLWITKFTNS